MSREGVLWDLGELYWDLVDPLRGGAGVRGDGDSVIGMPSSYSDSVREWERLYRGLRDSACPVERRLGWHLGEWWLRAERRVLQAPRVVRHGKRRRLMRDADGNVVTEPRRVWRRHPRASEVEARRAVGLMAERWSLPFEPSLPADPDEVLRRRRERVALLAEERRRRAVEGAA